MSNNIRQYAKKNETKEKNPFSRKPDKDFSESTSSPFAQVLHLQRTIGNKAVTRLIQSGAIQAKLKIGPPNDIYEQEADLVADKVMRMPEPKQSLVNGHSSSVQRESTCPECPEKEGIQTKPLAEQITPLIQRQASLEEEEEEPVQAKLLQRQESEEEEEAQTQLQRQPEEEEETAQAKAAPANTPEVTPGIESNINSIKGGGQPLSESSRSFFEPRFGANFSQVRVHNDSRAANTSQAINAKAFTTGKDIIFNSGQYSPGSSSGKRLLAHELTHVVQQSKHRPNQQLNCDTIQLEKENYEVPRLLNFNALKKENTDVSYNYIKLIVPESITGKNERFLQRGTDVKVLSHKKAKSKLKLERPEEISVNANIKFERFNKHKGSKLYNKFTHEGRVSQMVEKYTVDPRAYIDFNVPVESSKKKEERLSLTDKKFNVLSHKKAKDNLGLENILINAGIKFRRINKHEKSDFYNKVPRGKKGTGKYILSDFSSLKTKMKTMCIDPTGFTTDALTKALLIYDTSNKNFCKFKNIAGNLCDFDSLFNEYNRRKIKGQILINKWGTFRRPAKGETWSPYGQRKKPENPKETEPHYGIDIKQKPDKTVYAATGGIVLNTVTNASKKKKGYGNLIRIDHGTRMGEKYVTLYAHLSKIFVSPKECVYEGQKIGIMGESGRATGVHLHFEIIKNGSRINPEPKLTRK